ncbi:MAG: methylated-DNA--[protein]-cysteine S-methyltransferase [Firmicutes bacterium]|nr:methylated-DNA--[protein]-cysteine S-methyltransferase [Bacillota bacterium]MDY6160342.1 methylated-DNA--[protein]-cysteine S-methyltransferase [Candidatus Faecousia sp.]
MIRIQTMDSPLGELTLAEENGAIIGLWMQGQKYFPQLPEALKEQSPVLTQAERWLCRYFDGQRPLIQELPLNPKGSPFRREVWALLCRIPYGQTTSYAALAGQIARSRGIPHMSAQAVGNAVGHNPISILIPCHRVVGSSGQLTGYAGGLERKKWLLNWERNTK